MSGIALQAHAILGWFPGYKNIFSIKEEVEEALRNIGRSTPRHCALFLAVQLYLGISICTQVSPVLCHSFATYLVYSKTIFKAYCMYGAAIKMKEEEQIVNSKTTTFTTFRNQEYPP